MNENFYIKGGYTQKNEIPVITPLKSNQIQTEFFSAQRQKYEIQNKSSHPMNITTMSNNNPEFFNNQKEIYENQIPITIKSNEREDWLTFLNLKISFMIGNKIHNQILHLELTDESNNLFLYNLNLTETEFLSLKNEQSLIVDFQSFPAKLTELLELCINNHSNKDEKVNFSCVFEIKNSGESILNIIENNQFKSLIHLSLKFRAATDDILKSFLSFKLNKEKQENEELRITNQKLDETLNYKVNELYKMDSEMKKILIEKEKYIEHFSLEEQKKINDLKTISLEKETKIVKENEFEKKTLIDKYEKTLSEHYKKIDFLTNSNNELNELKLIYESKDREMSTKLNLLTKENSIMQKDLENLKADLKSLEMKKFSHEKIISELSIKNEGLEKCVQNKDEIIERNKELLENAYKQRDSFELNFNESKKTIDKMDGKLTKCGEEINKGNEIIRKLQDEISKKKEKIKMKNNLAIQQEQTINQMNEKLDAYNRQMNQSKKEHDNKDIKIRELETQLSEFKEKLFEGQKIIESNNSMIQYLNKCLNDQQKPMNLNGNSTIKSYMTNKYSTISQNTLSNEPRNENKNYLNNPYSTMNVKDEYKSKGMNYSINSKQYMEKKETHSISKSPIRNKYELEEKQINNDNNCYNFKYNNKEKIGLDYNDLNLNSSKFDNSGNYFPKEDNNFPKNNTIKPIKFREPSKRAAN